MSSYRTSYFNTCTVRRTVPVIARTPRRSSISSDDCNDACNEAMKETAVIMALQWGHGDAVLPGGYK